MIKKLFIEIWHTDLTVTTDKDGYAEFKGFFGEYTAYFDDMEMEFAIHKNESNRFDFLI